MYTAVYIPVEQILVDVRYKEQMYELVRYKEQMYDTAVGIPTWEPEANCENAKSAIKKFEERRDALPGYCKTSTLTQSLPSTIKLRAAVRIPTVGGRGRLYSVSGTVRGNFATVQLSTVEILKTSLLIPCAIEFWENRVEVLYPA